jgi:hypothetical protein
MKLGVDHSHHFLFKIRRFDNKTYHYQEKNYQHNFNLEKLILRVLFNFSNLITGIGIYVNNGNS